MAKYYAVKKGHKTGIYDSWEECKEQVTGFSGAQYKSFTSLEEAKQFIEKDPQVPIIEGGLIAYVDGSYNVKTKVYGYGVVILEGQTVKTRINGKGTHKDYVGMRNVAGEICGSEVAIKYAVKHGYPHIAIYYDYEGIEKWATGMWKANKVGTQAYVKMIQDYSKKIRISFIKVLAHSGDYFNDEADLLAKKAVGISE